VLIGAGAVGALVVAVFLVGRDGDPGPKKSPAARSRARVPLDDDATTAPADSPRAGPDAVVAATPDPMIASALRLSDRGRFTDALNIIDSFLAEGPTDGERREAERARTQIRSRAEKSLERLLGKAETAAREGRLDDAAGILEGRRVDFAFAPLAGRLSAAVERNSRTAREEQARAAEEAAPAEVARVEEAPRATDPGPSRGRARDDAARDQMCLLRISSTPPGATVWVDSIHRGTTPLTLTDLGPGTHSIVLKLAGHEEHKERAQLVIGRPHTVVATLARNAKAAARTPEEPEPFDPAVHRHCPYCEGKGLIKKHGCSACRRVGHKRMTRTKCAKCHGSGEVSCSCPRCAGAGHMRTGKKCSLCRGKGALPCVGCRGTGRIAALKPSTTHMTASCTLCDGSGFEQNTRCTVCGATGKIQVTTRVTSKATYYMEHACKLCGGDGKGPPICRACRGMGFTGSHPKVHVCVRCCGTGHVHARCNGCGGRGYVRVR
jgi:hypothetical protein